MRKVSLILALIMIFTSAFAFASCTAEKNEETEVDNSIDPANANIKDMVAKIQEAAPYEEYVSEILYKADDPDEMVKWTYGVVDIKGSELLSDYVITMYSDYSNTLAILKFDDGMTEDDFAEVKEVITNEYIRSRASALQMYMPEEYEKMNWALENPDAIWRQYGDNMLVLAIYGGEAPTAVWDAIDSYFSGK